MKKTNREIAKEVLRQSEEKQVPSEMHNCFKCGHKYYRSLHLYDGYQLEAGECNECGYEEREIVWVSEEFRRYMHEANEDIPRPEPKKFRVWDAITGRMHHSTWEPEVSYTVTNVDFPTPFEEDDYCLITPVDLLKLGLDRTQSVDTAVLMQYAGLKDKNLRDVFELDILQISFWEDDEFAYDIATVTYEQGKRVIKGRGGKVFDDLEDKEVEVIGNLLESKDFGSWLRRKAYGKGNDNRT